MRAKFNCYSVMRITGGGEQSVLQAVTDDGTPENESFWNATPSGRLEISITNPAAQGFFSPGTAYYLDFTEAV